MTDDYKKDLRVPTFCPLCDFTMKGKSTTTFYSHGVCIHCFIQFVDGREERWKAGWRPSEEQLTAHRNVVLKMGT